MQLSSNYTNSLNNYVIVNTTPQTTEYDRTLAEKVINWLGHSHILPESINVNRDKNDIVNYMRYLDAKISAVRKTTTFWDSYNIRDAAVSQIDFINKYGFTSVDNFNDFFSENLDDDDFVIAHQFEYVNEIYD